MARIYKLIVLFLILGFANCLLAQEKQDLSRKDALNIYLDISYNQQYIKENITFVNYVRDIKNADVHVLELTQSAANGGVEYSYVFTGNNSFYGKNDTLKFYTTADNTTDEIRQKQVKILKLGLMAYVAHSPFADKIDISFEDNLLPEIIEDRWKSWVFTLSSSAYIYGEVSYKSFYFWNSVSAQKITDKIKVETEYYNSFYKQVYVLSEDSSVSSTRNSNYYRILVAKTIGEHWALGFNADLGNSTYNNKRLFTGFWPTLEYNIFPYSKSNIVQLRFQYLIGPKYYKYYDTTVYDKMEQLVFYHHYGVAFQINKKWGDINSSITGDMYFHDLSQNRLNFYNSLNVRVFKGMSVSLSGSYSIIHDLFYLPKDDLTYEDILLQNKQNSTSFEAWISFGLEYTFGSIYNNVVNPRFNDIQ